MRQFYKLLKHTWIFVLFLFFINIFSEQTNSLEPNKKLNKKRKFISRDTNTDSSSNVESNKVNSIRKQKLQITSNGEKSV